jgi:hypothetical protein
MIYDRVLSYSVPQIDNAAYVVGLSERVRTRVEEFGRVELRETEAAALVRSKAVHLGLLVPSVLVMVWSENAPLFLMGPFLVFWLSAVAEAVATPGAGVVEKIQGVGRVTAAALLGLVGAVLLFMVAWLSTSTTAKDGRFSAR